MSCAFDKEKLTAYFDGELEIAEKGEVEKHISACSECLRELGEIKSAAGLVRTLPRLKAPASVAEGVRREVATTGRVHSFEKYRRSILWTFSAAAGLLVVATVSFFAAHQDRPATQPAPGPAAEEFARIESRRDVPEAGGLRKSVNADESGHPLDSQRRQALRNGELQDSATREEKAAAPPGAGFGKADGLEKNKDGKANQNRALAGEQKGGSAPVPAETPAAAAKQAGAQSEGKAPTAEALAKKLQDKPTAPGAPPAPAKAEPAKPESKREAMLVVKDADKAAGQPSLPQAKPKGAATSPFTIGTPQVAATRARAREILAKWSVPEANAAAADEKTSGQDPGFISVDLTPSQFAELKRQLETQAGVHLVAGGPETYRDAGQGPGGGKLLAGGTGGGKPAGDPKAPPPAARGAEAKPLAQGRAEEEGKESQAAEKAKESLKEADRLGAVQAQAQAQAEPRQKFILFFREVPPEK